MSGNDLGSGVTDVDCALKMLMGQWGRESLKEIITTLLSVIIKGSLKRGWASSLDGESVREHF